MKKIIVLEIFKFEASFDLVIDDVVCGPAIVVVMHGSELRPLHKSVVQHEVFVVKPKTLKDPGLHVKAHDLATTPPMFDIFFRNRKTHYC